MPKKKPNQKIDNQKLIAQLLKVYRSISEREKAAINIIKGVHSNYRESARNFIRYLALRTHDLKKIQDKLSCLGLSSIGHSERYTLANIENILFFLHALEGDIFQPNYAPSEHPINFYSSKELLKENTKRLFGEKNRKGDTRIMVTMPSEAAEDYELIDKMVVAGMDIARINCSHDSPTAWDKMIVNIKKAATAHQKECLIYMDLAGPKIRTGAVKITASLKKKKPINYITLKSGDQLQLYRKKVLGVNAIKDVDGNLIEPAKISITLPNALSHVKIGESIWFDDGAIGSKIIDIHTDYIDLEITRAAAKGSKLRAEKGINLPESILNLPSLTKEDLEHLPFIAANADVLGYSFVRTPADIRSLQNRLSRLERKDIGIVLKIETNEAFNNLPALILTAMKSPSIGVMIARGDLAVELGVERISEVQEQILWLCEAAHIPNIWATQVLETLAKEGIATRAEITDASMSVRAECVMLNKGPYITEAVTTLGNILERMDAHQQKRKGTLRALNVSKSFFKER